MKKVFAFTTLLLIFLGGCGGDSAPSDGAGAVRVAVQWPSALRVIPSATQSILIEISWQGRRLVRGFIPRSQSSVTYTGLPRNVVVSAAAMTGGVGSGTMLAAGTTELVLTPGTTTPADITLELDKPLAIARITDFRQAAGEGVPSGGTDFGPDGQLILAKPEPVSGGSFFLKRPIEVDRGFEIDFRFRITQPGGLNGGGDGFAVVLQGEGYDKTGVQGAGLGYEGLKNCIAFEFDMFRNDAAGASPNWGDPNNSHVAIMSNGVLANSGNHHTVAVSRIASISPSLLTTSAVRRGKIQYRNGVLALFVDSNLVLSLADSALPSGGNLAGFLGLVDGKAFLGMTGSTANAWAKIEISGRGASESSDESFKISTW